VILNGGFSAQLTHDIVVDTISTRLNKKATDAKSGAGGDAKRLGSHTSILRGRLGRVKGLGYSVHFFLLGFRLLMPR
jgi:hypothetical protein